MLGIYYTNVWDAKSQPFMSTRLQTSDGKPYPTAKVFVGGVLDETAFAKFGIPRLTGSFAYSMFIANAAVRINLIPLLPSRKIKFHAGAVKRLIV